MVAVADGYRESAGSWADLLRDRARRGMRAPVLAVGDGALGFWAALREVFPHTREQRDWVHESANVLAALPKSAQPGAKAALAEIWGAEDKTHAQRAAKRFANLYDVEFAKAVAKVTDDLHVLLTFYDYPAEHRWRAVNAPHLVALVRAGATFTGGQLVERPAEQTARLGRRRRPSDAGRQIATGPHR